MYKKVCWKALDLDMHCMNPGGAGSIRSKWNMYKTFKVCSCKACWSKYMGVEGADPDYWYFSSFWNLSKWPLWRSPDVKYPDYSKQRLLWQWHGPFRQNASVTEIHACQEVFMCFTEVKDRTCREAFWPDPSFWLGATLIFNWKYYSRVMESTDFRTTSETICVPSLLWKSGTLDQPFSWPSIQDVN